MIKIDSLHKSFGSNHVLRGIDLSIDEGKIIAVLGPNSSGKSTLIKCILGIVIPNSGTIEVNGTNVQKNWNYRKDIAYLPQIARFPENLTVNEMLKMIQDIRSQKSDPDFWIDFFDLYEFTDKRLSNLSGGTRQKVNLVQALMFNNPIVVLDEPTAGLDPVSMIKLKERLLVEKSLGKTILITSHIMNLIEELSDELVFILDGKIHFNGNPSDLKRMYEVDDFERAIAKLVSGEEPNIKLGSEKLFCEKVKKHN